MSRNKILFSILLLLFGILFFTDILFGSVSLSFTDLWNVFLSDSSVNSSLKTIIFDFRLPKTITAILAGIALSLSGLQMQTVFRNPLAGPYILGVSAGAGLGVALVVLSGISFVSLGIANNWLLIIAACFGAGLYLFKLLLISLRVKDIMTILIIGILYGSATAAIINILQYFSPESSLKTYIVWTMGSLSGVTISQLKIFAPIVLIGTLIVIFSSKMLNTMLLGEEYAKTMGLNVLQSRIVIFISTSILAGSITAFCGPIGFIGVAIPHIARILFKSANHNILIFASIFIGANAMMLSDIISQLAGNDIVLPINSVTAIIGIPIIIWIIIKNKNIAGV